MPKMISAIRPLRQIRTLIMNTSINENIGTTWQDQKFPIMLITMSRSLKKFNYIIMYVLSPEFDHNVKAWKSDLRSPRFWKNDIRNFKILWSAYQTIWQWPSGNIIKYTHLCKKLDLFSTVLFLSTPYSKPSIIPNVVSLYIKHITIEYANKVSIECLKSTLYSILRQSVCQSLYLLSV